MEGLRKGFFTDSRSTFVNNAGKSLDKRQNRLETGVLKRGGNSQEHSSAHLEWLGRAEVFMFVLLARIMKLLWKHTT